MFLGVPAQEWTHLLIKVTLLGIVSYVTSNYMLGILNPRDQQNRKKANMILKSIGVDQNIELNDYEIEIAVQICDPANINIDFSEIGGLDEVINAIKTDVTSLIRNPSVMDQSAYYRPPKGILLYGPPGCGKTMIAQAAAKESNARFINLNVSSLTTKWYGESNKLADAVFSLAVKISPCIIFIDELDTFLRSRSINDHEATVMMKAIFLQRWDGFVKDTKNKIIVMGASNRKSHIDEAILSRMDMQFEIKLPNFNQRKKILEKMIKSMNVDENVNLDEISKLTNGFSGRDLDDACREASMVSLREYLTEKEDNDSLEDALLRKVNKSDFEVAVSKKKRKSHIMLD